MICGGADARNASPHSASCCSLESLASSALSGSNLPRHLLYATRWAQRCSCVWLLSYVASCSWSSQSAVLVGSFGTAAAAEATIAAATMQSFILGFARRYL